MMKCLDEEMIEALVSGTLEGKDRADAVAHVRQCPGCRKTLRQTAVLYRALGPVFASETRDNCPAGEELALYDEGGLDPAPRRRIEEHLKACVRCAADLHELRTEREEFLEARHEPVLQRQPSITVEAIHAVCAAGGAISSIQGVIDRTVQGVWEFLDGIQLACFRPRAVQLATLTAATGGSFQKQTLTRPDSPFEVGISQFGDEVRISLRARPEAVQGQTDGVLRLILAEGQAVKLSRLVLIKSGKGSCVLRPAEVRACVPENQPLVARVEMVGVPQVIDGLKAAESVDALIGLLHHADPYVRCSAIEVLAELGASKAAALIGDLRTDPDETVRSAATKALERLPKD